MKRVAILFGLALTPAWAATADPKPEETEYKRLDGMWRAVSSESDGVEARHDKLLAEPVLTFAVGNFQRAGGQRGKIQRIVPTAAPKEIDYRLPAAEADARGIYVIEGDVFVECVAPLGADRPKAFTAPKGSGHTLTVYKRLRKKVD